MPEEVYRHFSDIAGEKAEAEAAWNVMFAAYCGEYPEMETLWNQYHDKNAARGIWDDEGFWTEAGEAGGQPGDFRPPYKLS